MYLRQQLILHRQVALQILQRLQRLKLLIIRLKLLLIILLKLHQQVEKLLLNIQRHSRPVVLLLEVPQHNILQRGQLIL